MLGSQTLKPVTFNRHLVARVHKKNKGRRVILAALMLTSMVDMFALLVIFLLQSFSTSPEILISKGVELPEARTGLSAEDAPILAIDRENLYLDHKKIGSVDQILRKPDELLKQLAALRAQWQVAHPNEAFPGKINLQADREVASTTISQLMAMLPTENYGSILLAVIGGGA